MVAAVRAASEPRREEAAADLHELRATLARLERAATAEREPAPAAAPVVTDDRLGTPVHVLPSRGDAVDSPHISRKKRSTLCEDGGTSTLLVYCSVHVEARGCIVDGMMDPYGSRLSTNLRCHPKSGTMEIDVRTVRASRTCLTTALPL